MSIEKIFETMEYGPALESRTEADQWLDSNKNQFDLFIDGNWRKPNSKKHFDSVNPADKKVLAKIAEADAKDVSAAVAAAKKAQDGWVKLGGHGRARYLYAIARQIQKHSRVISVLESLDNGKTIRESRDIDIPLVARHFYHHAGWAQLIESEMPDYKEIGVVGQIIPWNFPFLMLSWKIAPALAAGNTVVLKPAEFTSLTALFFAEICKNVGLPDGVVNVITGAGKTGEALVGHPDVKKIAFTGSTEVGKLIRRQTAGSGKKLSLELGGKSPFIVYEDADLDSVVEGIVDAIWFNQGQVCCAGSRLLVQESIEEVLIAKIKARMETLRIGPSLDKTVDISALVDKVQLKTVRDLVKKGVDDGAVLWQPSWECPTDGFYYPPTLFTNVSPSDEIAREEIFGPVLVAMSFRTPAESVALANNTRYGLAASIWTENVNLALDIAPKVKAGTVWINCTNMFDAASGFGGYRESGFGREGGKEGLYEYLMPKSNQLLGKGKSPKPVKAAKPSNNGRATLPAIDKTAKLYIGGKQTRPDGGNSYTVNNAAGQPIAELPAGNRKDIRNAVEAAHAASKWAGATAHNRAQVLYFLAENLESRADEFGKRLVETTGVRPKEAAAEIKKSIERIYYYAAFADKYDGNVHHTPFRNVTLAMPEAIGVMGVVCPEESPLLGFISSVIPAIAMGNTVVAIPSESCPLSVTDLYQVMETSDLPGGVVNIVTGNSDELSKVLADHYDVDGMWYFGSEEGSKQVELSGAENMKRTWVNNGMSRDWSNNEIGQGQEFLRHATQIKNIWVPYGE